MPCLLLRIKRVGRLSSVESTRVREGDEVVAVVPGSTLDSVVFFADDGTAYTMRINEVPATTGHGEPITKFFKLADGVKVIGAVSTDPRFTHRLAGRWQPSDPAIGRVALGHAPAIEGTQDPVIGVEGRGSERGPLGADLAVEAMSGPASVALELVAQLAHVLALDLVDGADALPGQRRQNARSAEWAASQRSGTPRVRKGN